MSDELVEEFRELLSEAGGRKSTIEVYKERPDREGNSRYTFAYYDLTGDEFTGYFEMDPRNTGRSWDRGIEWDDETPKNYEEVEEKAADLYVKLYRKKAPARLRAAIKPSAEEIFYNFAEYAKKHGIRGVSRVRSGGADWAVDAWSLGNDLYIADQEGTGFELIYRIDDEDGTKIKQLISIPEDGDFNKLIAAYKKWKNKVKTIKKFDKS